jgi:hypothetical protein
MRGIGLRNAPHPQKAYMRQALFKHFAQSAQFCLAKGAFGLRQSDAKALGGICQPFCGFSRFARRFNPSMRAEGAYCHKAGARQLGRARMEPGFACEGRQNAKKAACAKFFCHQRQKVKCQLSNPSIFYQRGAVFVRK